MKHCRKAHLDYNDFPRLFFALTNVQNEHCRLQAILALTNAQQKSHQQKALSSCYILPTFGLLLVNMFRTFGRSDFSDNVVVHLDLKVSPTVKLQGNRCHRAKPALFKLTFPPPPTNLRLVLARRSKSCGHRVV